MVIIRSKIGNQIEITFCLSVLPMTELAHCNNRNLSSIIHPYTKSIRGYAKHPRYKAVHHLISGFTRRPSTIFKYLYSHFVGKPNRLNFYKYILVVVTLFKFLLALNIQKSNNCPTFYYTNS